MFKLITRYIVYSVLFLFVVSACNKEQDDKMAAQPLISLTEVGYENSKVAYTGHDLHIDAEINAEGKIADIRLQITLKNSGFGWDFLKIYTDGYTGLRNAQFHEHISIPEDARTGTYTLVLIVTDEAGNRSELTSDFEIRKDLSLPSISNIQLNVNGGNLIVACTLNAVNKIAQLEVEIQSSGWSKTFTYEEEMKNQETFTFHQVINISEAPAGHYHVNITLTDMENKVASSHLHFDK